MFVITFWLFRGPRPGVRGFNESELTMNSPGIPVQENRLSRKACRKKCDGQNARLPLPNDLKLGGLNGLVTVFYIAHCYFLVWMSLKPFLVRKLSENDRNYFLRSSRQNETMFVSGIGMAFHHFFSLNCEKKIYCDLSCIWNKRHWETIISQVQVLHIWVE